MEPGRTVTLTLVLPAAAETTVEGRVGLGAEVSQTTVWLEVGWLAETGSPVVTLMHSAPASRSPAMAASVNAKHSDEIRPAPRMS
jgi:hypothetical protein